jgi:hypothetical protein
MSQFCIDFKGMMLPDAIAAVVEAWYDAQMQEINKAKEIKAKEVAALTEAMSKLDLDIDTSNKMMFMQENCIKIERRGKKISIRALLPCKNNFAHSSYQRISLGLSATHENIDVALLVATEIIRQRKTNAFCWSSWSKREYVDAIIDGSPRLSLINGI